MMSSRQTTTFVVDNLNSFLLMKENLTSMAKDKLATITDAEWEVMRVIWTQGKTTSREVHTLLNEKKEWKSTTVKTLLSRLTDKGLVGTEK